MNDKKKIKYFFILGIPSFIILVIFLGKYEDSIYKEYPLLKQSNSLNMVVKVFDQHRGTTLLIDIEGNKYSIRARDRSTSPRVLSYYLNIGDSIVVIKGESTLTLYKKSGDTLKFDIEYWDD